MAKAYLRSGSGRVITWTNSMTASANVTVNDLVHLGNGKIGVAADNIAHAAKGAVIVEGDFSDCDVILNETLGIGQMLRSNSANIAVISTLQTHAITAGATAGLPWPSNMRLMKAVTAAGTATTSIDFRLDG